MKHVQGYFAPFSSVSIVNFEHAIAGWTSIKTFDMSLEKDYFDYVVFKPLSANISHKLLRPSQFLEKFMKT